jgi:uncharacterized spore protein YtfJ
MNARDMVQTIADRLGTTATVKSVFGEPIQANGKIVVPVAKVAYGFGGGFGTGRDGAGQDREGEGGGGGGGVRAYPAGALEISDRGTRFVPFVDLTMVFSAAAAAGVLGFILGQRAR